MCKDNMDFTFKYKKQHKKRSIKGFQINFEKFLKQGQRCYRCNSKLQSADNLLENIEYKRNF